MQQTELI